MTEPNYEEEISNGTNKHAVRCKFCNSLMLSKQHGRYIKHEKGVPIPHMLKNSKDPSLSETDELTDFWWVDDMFKFENIGFSNVVGTVKYLICADCDMGPVGYHDTAGQNVMFCVALSRVKHQD